MLCLKCGKAFVLQHGGAVPVQSQPVALGTVSTDRPCSVGSQGEEMDFAAYPGHLLEPRFFWYP